MSVPIQGKALAGGVDIEHHQCVGGLAAAEALSHQRDWLERSEWNDRMPARLDDTGQSIGRP